VYSWFFRYQRRLYRDLIGDRLGELEIAAGDRVLDVGCGPGAFGAAFTSYGFETTGVDGAPNMVAKANKNGLGAVLGDITAGLPFPDRSFHLLTAAYVAHGLRPTDRLSMYREMCRLGSRQVLLHDFPQSTEPFGRWSVAGVLERLERSYYESFMTQGMSEMREVFATVREVCIGDRLSWYLCTP